MRIALVCSLLAVALEGCAKRAPPPEKPVEAPAPAVDPKLLEAQIQKALDLRAAGKHDEGIALLEKTRLQALDAKQPAIATLALNRRGDLANDLGRKQEAAQDYELAYTEAEARADYAAMGRAAHDRALLKSDVWGAGEPDALVWYPKAVEARRKAKDFIGVRRSANNLAIQYFYAEKKDEALRWYGEAAEAAEAASDWDGLYRVHANLALLWAVAAEGAFTEGKSLRAWVPPAKLNAEAEGKAKEHYGKALEAALKIGRSEQEVCGVFGNYGARCRRLSPATKPGEGMVAFFAELALEANGAQDPRGLDAPGLQEALLTLRAADAAKEAGPELAKEAEQFTKSTKEQFDALAKAGGGAEAYCKAESRAEELCTRFKSAKAKKK
jgi:hypothetical protein